MIAYGAVIGKATPTQLMWMLLALVPAYAGGAWVRDMRLPPPALSARELSRCVCSSSFVGGARPCVAA